MTAPALLSAHDSGVYRTPATLDRLRERAQRSGVAWLEADLTQVFDKAQVLEKIARACDFPATFGANWDALADSMQDLGWRPARAYVLHLSHATAATRALGQDWHTLMHILGEAALYWKERATVFVVLVDGAADLPDWK